MTRVSSLVAVVRLDAVGVTLKDVFTHALQAGLLAHPKLFEGGVRLQELASPANACCGAYSAHHATSLITERRLALLESLCWCRSTKLPVSINGVPLGYFALEDNSITLLHSLMLLPKRTHLPLVFNEIFSKRREELSATTPTFVSLGANRQDVGVSLSLIHI